MNIKKERKNIYTGHTDFDLVDNGVKYFTANLLSLLCISSC